jgi:hypothetical protein
MKKQNPLFKLRKYFQISKISIDDTRRNGILLFKMILLVPVEKLDRIRNK